MSAYEKDAQAWEDVYLNNPVKDLPWNAGGPDVELVRLVKEGSIPVGQALDIGTGPGHDAVYLIQNGFNVIAIDISPTAVIRARENASEAGLFGFFQQGDLRHIPVEDAFIDFANDRGCFHALDIPDRPIAVNEVARVLKKRGLYLLHVFSDKEPLRPRGPHHFNKKELEDLFTPQFKILKLWEHEAQGPRKPIIFTVLMEKK